MANKHIPSDYYHLKITHRSIWVIIRYIVNTTSQLLHHGIQHLKRRHQNYIKWVCIHLCSLSMGVFVQLAQLSLHWSHKSARHTILDNFGAFKANKPSKVLLSWFTSRPQASLPFMINPWVVPSLLMHGNLQFKLSSFTLGTNFNEDWICFINRGHGATIQVGRF